MSEVINDGIKQTNDEDKFLRMWTHQVMHCTLRGIVGCFPQVRAEKLILVACMALAQLIAEMYTGDEVTVHRFRKSARDIFDEMTRKLPVVPMPGASLPPAAETASINLKGT